MKSIKVPNTYSLKLSGAPSLTIKPGPRVERVGVTPCEMPFVKPRLLVKEGDAVKIGTPLFSHKKDDRIKFLSPGAGVVDRIVFGPRRAVLEVSIKLDAQESAETFSQISSDRLATLDRSEIVRRLCDGGLWPLLRAFPFRGIADPDATPPAIYVSIEEDEPFKPSAQVMLDRNEDVFFYGIEILKRLCPVVHIGAADHNATVKTKLKSVITHTLSGQYPANDPGVFLYHNKKSADENKSWFIDAQSVLLIASFFDKGVYPIERIVSVGGPLVKNAFHYRTRQGVSADALVQLNTSDPARFIAGGVLTGRRLEGGRYLSLYENAVNVIREGQAPELLTFFRPGFDKPTYSGTYLSAALPDLKAPMTSSLNGGHRSCIACGICPEVCPTDVLPQFLMKSILAGDVEEAVSHGLLDCSECGLCTYVCPSKIELGDIFSTAKQNLVKQLEAPEH